MQPLDSTRELLERCSAGDRDARVRLVERDLEWVREHVQRHARGLVLLGIDEEDIVQEVMVDILQSGGRFIVQSQQQFRRLMGCIVKNALCSIAARTNAKKRDRRRQRPLGTDTVLYLGCDRPSPGLQKSVTQPDQRAERDEEEAYLRLAMELLDGTDQVILQMRRWDGRSYQEIATELGIGQDAIRMRAQRALVKLGKTIGRLKSGELDAILAEQESGSRPSAT